MDATLNRKIMDATVKNDIKQIKIRQEKFISRDLKDSALKSQTIRIEIYSCYMFLKKRISLFDLCQFLLEKHLSIYSGSVSIFQCLFTRWS